MDMLRIAFKHSPKEAAKVMNSIYKDDKRISNLVKKLSSKINAIIENCSKIYFTKILSN